MAVLAFAIAALAVLFLGPAGGSRQAADSKGERGSPSRNAPGAPATTAPSTSAPPASASPSSRPVGMFTMLPPPCGTVGRPTVNRLVPKATTKDSANTTLATCTYASAGPDSQWLRVETRIFGAFDGAGPAEAAAGFFGAQWTRAGQDPVVRTVSLKRHEGLGDEAYRWYKIDKGQPTVVGEVAVRLRNAVITVSYSGRAPGRDDSAANEQKYLAAASGVAREVVGALK